MSEEKKGVTFRLYREGEDLETLTVSEELTVGQLGEIHKKYGQAGFAVLLNGIPASLEELKDIASSINTKGTSIRIGTERAGADSLIPDRAIITMSGEQKGGR